ncbi:SIR2 family protein [Gemella morbillorum]|uniref:SIR2 family protein n=1 Tax=Gemella morbillorum TaxID=29391 RepID=UPI001CADF895|nr:SIR2 family protein [Gemella morbillorum]MBF1212570.1 SIR2 family protein [Gemella morbillorum]
MDKKQFIRKYSKIIIEGNAAVFAGAGTSVPAGFVNWKELVKPFADEIRLDIEKETDLIGLTQYYINSKRGNRGTVNQEIVNQFSSQVAETEVINLLTRLPISTYWTTNYDKVIENALEKNNRKCDIKRKKTDLTYSVPDRDAVVYKMHGDVDSPGDAVISKDDYAKYSDINSLFVTALRGDLVSKNFLFVGFSFEDPNLDTILGKLHILLGEHQREHFCIQKEVLKQDYSEEKDYEYACIKQELKIEDLKRYGIETILIENFSKLPVLLREVEREVLKNNIFISGSITYFNENWSEKNVNKFCYDFSRFLVSKNYKIISGFGLGIGSSIINGALDEIYNKKFNHVSKYLGLFPFPQHADGEMDIKELWTSYRRKIIEKVGVCLFIFGNKKDENNDIVDADGMMEEFHIAQSTEKIIIPVGSTGFTAKKIFDEMKKSGRYSYLDEYWNILETEKDYNIVYSVIDKIIKEQ